MCLLFETQKKKTENQFGNLFLFLELLEASKFKIFYNKIYFFKICQSLQIKKKIEKLV